MMNTRRDRVVVFRVSQDEYLSLKNASDRSGACNISEFTRAELLDRIHTGPCGKHLERSCAVIDEKLRRLDSIVAQLANLLRDRYRQAGHTGVSNDGSSKTAVPKKPTQEGE